MSDVIIRTPMQYLDRALTTLRDMGIVPAKGEDAPINALLQKISDLDNERITVIARTLNQHSTSLLRAWTSSTKSSTWTSRPSGAHLAATRQPTQACLRQFES